MLAFFGVAALAGVALCLILLLVALVRKRRKAPALIGLGVCVVVFAVCLDLTAPRSTLCVPPPSPTPSLSVSQPATAPTAPSPAPIPSEAVPPAPSSSQSPPPASPEPDYDAQLAAHQSEVEQAATDAMADLFDEAAGSTVTFTPSTGSLLIDAQGSDNMSVKLIRAAMLADIRDVMSTLSPLSFSAPTPGADEPPALGLEKVMFSIRFPLGGEVPVVLKATFTRETMDTADWSAMDATACADAADEFWTAPALN